MKDEALLRLMDSVKDGPGIKILSQASFEMENLLELFGKMGYLEVEFTGNKPH